MTARSDRNQTPRFDLVGLRIGLRDTAAARNPPKKQGYPPSDSGQPVTVCGARIRGSVPARHCGERPVNGRTRCRNHGGGTPRGNDWCWSRGLRGQAMREARSPYVPRPPHQRRCHQCGSSFTQQGRGRARLYCSRACAKRAAYAAAKTRRDHQCARCGLPARYRYCSTRCSLAATSAVRTAKLRELGRARRMPPEEKAEHLRSLWRAAARRKRQRRAAATAA
jgi:hypothetical protein